MAANSVSRDFPPHVLDISSRFDDMIARLASRDQVSENQNDSSIMQIDGTSERCKIEKLNTECAGGTTFFPFCCCGEALTIGDSVAPLNLLYCWSQRCPDPL